MGDTRSAAEIVAAMVDQIEAEPEHVYWWGFGDEKLALVRQPDDAAAAIEGTFRHASVKVRRYMARLLRGLDRSRAKASLVALLFDPEDAVRLEACGAVLGEIPMHPHVPEGEEVPVVDPTVRGDLVRSLAELLSSSKPYVQSDARRMLGRLGGSDVVDVLTKRMRKDVKHTLLPAIQRKREGR